MLEAWLLVTLINGKPQLVQQFETHEQCVERKELIRMIRVPGDRSATLECYRKEVNDYPGIPG